MSGEYLVCYTLFGARFNGFKSFVRHFDNFEKMQEFVYLHNLENNCICYKKIPLNLEED